MYIYDLHTPFRIHTYKKSLDLSTLISFHNDFIYKNICYPFLIFCHDRSFQYTNTGYLINNFRICCSIVKF